MKLTNKSAVITGGARGIGLAIAQRYLSEGASVVVADIDRAAIDTALATLQQQAPAEKVMGVELNVCDQASIDAMVNAVTARFGGIDILVNNAAIFDMAPVLEVTEASFDKQFAVNTKGMFLPCRRLPVRWWPVARGVKSSIWPPRQVAVVKRW